MTYRYHVHVRGPNESTKTGAIASFNRFDDARSVAEQCYIASTLDTLVEITHAGLIVWGPFVVGGSYRPMGVK